MNVTYVWPTEQSQFDLILKKNFSNLDIRVVVNLNAEAFPEKSYSAHN